MPEAGVATLAWGVLAGVWPGKGECSSSLETMPLALVGLKKLPNAGDVVEAVAGVKLFRLLLVALPKSAKAGSDSMGVDEKEAGPRMPLARAGGVAGALFMLTLGRENCVVREGDCMILGGRGRLALGDASD